MIDKKQTGIQIIAVWLFALLMLPSVVEFVHTFEQHTPVSCHETTTHIHKLAPKCELCDTLLTAINYDITQHQELVIAIIPVKVETNFASLQYHSYQTTNTRLRAPPVLS